MSDENSPHYILGQLNGIIKVAEIMQPLMVGPLEGIRKKFVKFAGIEEQDEVDKSRHEKTKND